LCNNADKFPGADHDTHSELSAGESHPQGIVVPLIFLVDNCVKIRLTEFAVLLPFEV